MHDIEGNAPLQPLGERGVPFMSAEMIYLATVSEQNDLTVF